MDRDRLIAECWRKRFNDIDRRKKGREKNRFGGQDGVAILQRAFKKRGMASIDNSDSNHRRANIPRALARCATFLRTSGTNMAFYNNYRWYSVWALSFQTRFVSLWFLLKILGGNYLELASNKKWFSFSLYLCSSALDRLSLVASSLGD